RCAAVSSPEVQIPGCGCGNLSLRDLVARNGSKFWILHACDVATCAHRRKLVGARDSDLRLSLQNSGCRDAYIVVVLQSGTNQRLKFGIPKHLPPFFITQRLHRRPRGRLWGLRLARLRLRGSRGASRRVPIRDRNIDGRTPVVRTDSATDHPGHSEQYAQRKISTLKKTHGINLHFLPAARIPESPAGRASA